MNASYQVPDYKLEPEYCRCEYHAEECGCSHCHECKEHKWQDWNVYPECEACVEEMLECWAEELQEAA